MTYSKDTMETDIKPYEAEQAANAYLMSVVAVIAGLPLPIINVLASLLFFAAKRKSPYAVRWHSLQSLLGQVIVMPFNSLAFWWTFRIFFSHLDMLDHNLHIGKEFLTFASPAYWAYMCFALLLNIFEFIAVIATAVAVRKGKNIRWFGIAAITDVLCSKENRDPYAI